jgi:hypothetical protein
MMQDIFSQIRKNTENYNQGKNTMN